MMERIADESPRFRARVAGVFEMLEGMTRVPHPISHPLRNGVGVSIFTGQARGAGVRGIPPLQRTQGWGTWRR
jgi:hypothetical protein